MSKRVTLNDGARVEDHRHHLLLHHHRLRLVESKLAEGRPEIQEDDEEVESAARHIDGSLASSTTAEQWRKKGSGKKQLQTSGRQPSGGVQQHNIEGSDREQASSPPAAAMVEQLESSAAEAKKRGFEQVCILSRNPNDEADFGFQDEYADEATEDEEDSYEKVALGIGMLQARVMSLRSQLRDSMFHRPAGRHAKSVAVRFRSAAGGLPSSSATAAAAAASASAKGYYARRKASDYDINNVVMPVSVGANYVEHIRHERIETPKWRLVGDEDDAAQHAAEASSSSDDDENTDDETYHRRHAELEAREKRNRIPEKKPASAAPAGGSEGQKSKSRLKPKGGPTKPKSKAGRPRKHKLPTLDSDQQQLNN